MADYTHGQMRSEIGDLERELGLAEPPKTFRDEIRDVIHAPRGSDVAKARRTLGWTLVLAGLFGIPLVFLAVVLIGALLGLVF